MKKIVPVCLVLFLLSSCSPKQEKVEKFMENGVEVVVNHLEPYKIKGEPNALTLEEEFVIDTERDDLAKLGLTDISGFDVDSEGTIFLFNGPLSQGNPFYVFNKKGTFMSSFGQKGQGPGQIQFPCYQRINYKDEIPVVDGTTNNLLIFNKNGVLLKQNHIDIRLGTMGAIMLPLENGNYLIRRTAANPNEAYINIILSLFNSDLKEIKELDRYRLSDPLSADKFRFPLHVSSWAVSKGNIFIGDEDKGYEIWVYDLSGNLRRKIKKEYDPIGIPQGYRKEIIEQSMPSHLRKILYFPTNWPPFQLLFADDLARLFVMTYEKGKNPKEHVFDIFNPGGVFIGRKALNILLSGNIFAPGSPMDSWVTMKKNHFYCLREKESGYMQLVVYKMSWE